MLGGKGMNEQPKQIWTSTDPRAFFRDRHLQPTQDRGSTSQLELPLVAYAELLRLLIFFVTMSNIRAYVVQCSSGFAFPVTVQAS